MGEVLGAVLEVPGARLHYQTRGSGPMLLILQGGAGDADGSSALADGLSDGYTVLTYDRRGLSRSTVDDPEARVDMAVHRDDAHRLLGAVTGEPALVFGASFGALLGLDLVAVHPEQVRLVVAHEPPAAGLLAEPARSRLQTAQRDIEEAFRRHGVGAAMQGLAAISGLAPGRDRGPGIEMPVPSPERVAAHQANFPRFLAHDAPAAHRYEVDLAVLRAHAGKIVAAAGSSSRETLPGLCAEALAHALGRELVVFPGGHSAYALAPGTFAQALRIVLQEAAGAT